MAYKIKDPAPSCLECGQAVYGRKGRKFCSDSCKNRYHNRQLHIYSRIRLKIMNALDRNYEILSQLLSQGITAIDRIDLLQTGFRPDCITAHRKVSGHDEYRCFDIKYILTPTHLRRLDRVAIPRMEDPGRIAPSHAGESAEND